MKKSLLPSVELFSTNQVEIHFKRPLFDSMFYLTHVDDVETLIKKIHKGRSFDVKEYFWLINLTTSNRVLSVSEISVGTINTTCVNIREIFQQALLMNAFAFIVVHNHPSGNLTPSKSDIELTKSIEQGAKNLGLVLLDHVIITSETVISLASDGHIDTTHYKKQ